MPETVRPDFYERMIARHSLDSIIITGTDGITEWVNEAFTRMTGYQLDDMVGKKPGAVLQGSETETATIQAISDALRNRTPIRTEIRNIAKSLRPFWIDLLITPIFDEDGKHTHFMSIQRDITERKEREQVNEDILRREKHREAERSLVGQLSEWLYTAKSLDELLMVVRRGMETLIPEAEGALFFYAASRDTLDLAAYWGGAEALDRVKPDQCWALRRGRAYSFGTRAIEFTCDHVSGAECPYFCLPIVANGETIGLLHLCFTGLDVTIERRSDIEVFMHQRWRLALSCAEQISLAVANVRLRQELLDQSVRDPLTGLWNRRWLLETIHKVQNRARQANIPFSIISLDIDHFKQFNDHYGHDAGDTVLRDAAKMIADLVDRRGHVCRMGGEEFVIICPDLDHEPTCRLAEELRTALATHQITYAGEWLPAITISSGVASFPDDGVTVVDLMRIADMALYAAKDRGRDRTLSCRELRNTKLDRTG